MSHDQSRRLYSVERRAHERQGGGGLPAFTGSMAVSTDGGGISNEALLEEIKSLRAEVAQIRSASAPVIDSGLDEDSLQDVRIEVAQMVRSIGRAKAEIAAIKHPMSAEDQMEQASMQLDTIVQTTERATEDIMSASDQIEATVKKIHALTLEDTDVQLHLDEVSNQLIAIIEACSFQDLTGQRITQVIKTLRFIEQRILAMIDIWGLEAFQDLPVPGEDGEVDEDGISEEEDLLNGPALGGAGLSQADIDALFD